MATEVVLDNPGNLNITWRRGQDVPLKIQIKDSLGAIMDLTGATFSCVIKFEDSPTTVANVTPTMNLTTVTNPNDAFTFTLTPSQTYAMQAGAYRYDIYITLSGVRLAYVKGIVTVNETVTPYP